MKTTFFQSSVGCTDRVGQSGQPFESIYKQYVGKVYKHCLLMTHSSLLAEDYTQDIFLKVFTTLNSFENRSSLSTWLSAITYNYCTDQLRLANRLNLTALSAELEECLFEPTEPLVLEEKLLLLTEALETLSLRERTLLQMKYEEGYSIDQLANLHQLKQSAVKMRLKRSREKVYQFCQRATGAVK